MTVLNGKAHSKRFVLTLIGFIGCLIAAVLKHWITGLSVELVITGAGLVTAYNAAESWRPSPTEAKPCPPPTEGQR